MKIAWGGMKGTPPRIAAGLSPPTPAFPGRRARLHRQGPLPPAAQTARQGQAVSRHLQQDRLDLGGAGQRRALQIRATVLKGKHLCVLGRGEGKPAVPRVGAWAHTSTTACPVVFIFSYPWVLPPPPSSVPNSPTV